MKMSRPSPILRRLPASFRLRTPLEYHVGNAHTRLDVRSHFAGPRSTSTISCVLRLHRLRYYSVPRYTREEKPIPDACPEPHLTLHQAETRLRRPGQICDSAFPGQRPRPLGSLREAEGNLRQSALSRSESQSHDDGTANPTAGNAAPLCAAPASDREQIHGSCRDRENKAGTCAGEGHGTELCDIPARCGKFLRCRAPALGRVPAPKM